MLILSRYRTPYFIAAWFLTWATSTSPILSRSPNAVTSKYNPTKYPIVVNIFFVAVPILVVAIILPLSCIATQGTNEVWYMTVELRNRLSMDAEAFESGNMTGLIDPRNMLEDFHVACIPIWQETVKNVQKVWWSWSIFTAFLFTVSTNLKLKPSSFDSSLNFFLLDVRGQRNFSSPYSQQID